jgi:hypothetical protein
MLTNSLKPRSRSRARARGAASVEAVVVLPIFLVLFISVFYVRDQVITKQAAQERARTCAWLYSANNCEFDENLMPAECKDVVSEVPIASDAAKAITDKLTGDGFFQDIVSKMIDSALEDAFGRAIDVTVQRSVERPALYGGNSQAMTGEYHLACNLKPKTKLDVAKDAWSRVNPFK